MKRFNNARGFTLIELLVVIAIIGILSSVVLASLNTARLKGADAAVKSNLANMRAQASLYYDNNSSAYGTVGQNNLCGTANTLFADPVVLNAAAAITNASAAPSCRNDNNNWAMYAPLKSNAATFWCVDSTGASLLINAALAAGVDKCN